MLIPTLHALNLCESMFSMTSKAPIKIYREIALHQGFHCVIPCCLFTAILFVPNLLIVELACVFPVLKAHQKQNEKKLSLVFTYTELALRGWCAVLKHCFRVRRFRLQRHCLLWPPVLVLDASISASALLPSVASCCFCLSLVLDASISAPAPLPPVASH